MAIRVVVVGLGGRGRDWVRTARAHPAFDVVAGADPDASVRAAVRGEPALPVFASLPDALGALTADVAIIATPPARHAEDALLAVRAGLHVLVEKPFAVSLRDAYTVVSAAALARRAALVGQNYRWMRAWRTVRRLVTDGSLGRLHHVAIRYYRDAHIVNDGLRHLSSVALWETGVHYVDLLRVIAGGACVSAQARVADVPWVRELPGTSADVTLAFENGTCATCSVAYGSGGHHFFERGQETYARLMGERGTLHVFHRWLVWCPRGGWPRLVGRGPREVTEEHRLLDDLADAVTTGRATDCSAEDNLRTIAILEACERSAFSGLAVNPTSLLDALEGAEDGRPS